MSSDEKSLDNPPDMRKIVISTFLDTTWRMFTPILVSTLAGWFIDRFTGTRPVATLTGLAFGIIITSFLMYKLYKKVTSLGCKERNR